MLPEMFVCPYQKDFMLKSAESIAVGDESATTANLLSQLAKETNTYIIGGSIPEKIQSESQENNKIFNTCLCFNNQGKVVATHRK